MIQVHEFNDRIRYVPDEWIKTIYSLSESWLAHSNENKIGLSEKYIEAYDNLYKRLGESPPNFSDSLVLFSIQEPDHNGFYNEDDFEMRYDEDEGKNVQCAKAEARERWAKACEKLNPYYGFKLRLNHSRLSWLYIGPAEHDSHFMNELHGGEWFNIPGQASHIFNPEKLPVTKNEDIIVAGYSHFRCAPAPGIFTVYKSLSKK